MSKTNIRYWLCQILGWGLWGLIIMYFSVIVFGDRFEEQGGKKEYIVSLIIFLVCAISAGVILQYGGNAIERHTAYSYENFTQNRRLEKAKKLEKDAGLDTKEYYLPSSPIKDSLSLKAISQIKKNSGWYRNSQGEWKYEDKTDLFGIYQNLLLIAIWLLIYIVYHYVENNRKDQLDRLRLESNIKELELKTIKSHINPHFIFNSLNSIRALVDENPERARRAITELSNILRSSMQAEKAETVTLEKELSIVKDYLELEQMRFEERLQVQLEIDEDTLTQLVPPMMLQTLVENAVKHGISKQVNGGLVKIIADFKGDHLELMVQNTGRLETAIKNGDGGFGIKSTEDRLNLMYQGKASFAIKNINGNMVESKVTMPVVLPA